MKKIRNLIKTLSVLTMMLIVSCQEDSFVDLKQNETALNKSSYSSSTIYKEAIQANEKLSNQIRRLKIIQPSNTSKSVYNATYGFTINTDVAKLVESANDNSHSYTFSIDRDNYVDSVVENIVFSYDVVNDDYSAGLVTYHFSAEQKQEYLANGHIGTPYNISFSSIDVSIDDVLNKSELPCTVTYQEFHQPQGSSNTYLYSSNGTVLNNCEHEKDDDPCDTYTEIIIYCPNGGAAGTTHDTGTSEPSDTNTNDYSNAGGSGSTNDDTVTNDEPEDSVVTSILTREERIKESILNCINGLTPFSSTDLTTINPEIIDEINFSLNQWLEINNFLETNNCSEDAQQEVIEEILEEAIKNAIIPPSCESFEYSNVGSNWQAAATKNIVALIGYYDVATGEFNTANVLFTQPIYFEVPKYSEYNDGYISPGRAAELTAKALFLAIKRTKAYFLATNASQSQVRAKLWEYIRDEMTNGTYIVGGRASYIPPSGFTGNIIDYQSYWFFEDNCD